MRYKIGYGRNLLKQLIQEGKVRQVGKSVNTKYESVKNLYGINRR